MKQLILSKKNLLFRTHWSWLLLACLFLPHLAEAQYYSSGFGDVNLGFRKTNPSGNYEAVVKAGNITNLLAKAPGSVTTITTFSGSQLADAFSDFNDLEWSASAGFNLFGAWAGFPQNTIWYTQPRANPNVPSAPLARLSDSAQALVMQRITSVGNNAGSLSMQLGATGADNNSTFVREPVGNGFDYSIQVKSKVDATVGNFQDYLPSPAENTTPSDFATQGSVSVCDLYQSVPAKQVDPITGATNGAAYYVGYFTLHPDGSMTFTRATTSAPQPPAPAITAITRTNTTTYISFTTTNGGFNYSLYFTNSTGLGSAVTNWPHAGAIAGDGSVKTLTDTTSEALRFYRVGVQ